ncbi:hypothetical protein DESC_480058 [Desulfosarcina cetonica]|nr:hypothetical protein DESC_480058 [Desulfosarcina cetonica]
MWLPVDPDPELRPGIGLPGGQRAAYPGERIGPIRLDPLACPDAPDSAERPVPQKRRSSGGGRLRTRGLSLPAPGIFGWQGGHAGLPQVRRCPGLYQPVRRDFRNRGDQKRHDGGHGGALLLGTAHDREKGHGKSRGAGAVPTGDHRHTGGDPGDAIGSSPFPVFIRITQGRTDNDKVALALLFALAIHRPRGAAAKHVCGLAVRPFFHYDTTV